MVSRTGEQNKAVGRRRGEETNEGTEQERVSHGEAFVFVHFVAFYLIGTVVNEKNTLYNLTQMHGISLKPAPL